MIGGSLTLRRLSAVGALAATLCLAGLGFDASVARAQGADAATTPPPSVIVSVAVPSATPGPTPTPSASAPAAAPLVRDTVTVPSTAPRSSSTSSSASGPAATGSAASGPAAPQVAATPQPDAGGALISPDHLRPGDTATVTGTGYTPGEQVQLVLYSAAVVVGSFAADDTGTVRAEFTVPADLGIGRHVAELTGWQSARVQNVAFTVDGSPAPASVGLSSDQWRLVLAAGALVLLLIASVGTLISLQRPRQVTS